MDKDIHHYKDCLGRVVVGIHPRQYKGNGLHKHHQQSMVLQ
jgi:hypothetical protein